MVFEDFENAGLRTHFAFLCCPVKRKQTLKISAVVQKAPEAAPSMGTKRKLFRRYERSLFKWATIVKFYDELRPAF